jgi:predicted nucleic acid-binding protein
MIFDTGVPIWFLRGDGGAARLIESQSDRAGSIVSAMELLQGARSRDEIKTIHQFMQQSGIRLVPVNESISHVALSLIEAHAIGEGLRVADALIAATALPLATGNARHFKAIAGLEVKCSGLARSKSSTPASSQLPPQQDPPRAEGSFRQDIPADGNRTSIVILVNRRVVRRPPFAAPDSVGISQPNRT